MANETLSPRQAKQIGSQFEMIVNQAVKEIQSNFTEFFEDMGREWEDHYAVELSNKLKDAMQEVTTHLQQNSNAFVSTVSEIAKAYATTGGVAAVVIASPVIAALNIVSNIKESFDGDMFGFKNVDSSDKIATAITKLVSKLNSTISETNSKIRGINAFGNEQVIANLAISGGEVIRILQDAVKQVETSTKKSLGEAAAAYKKTGSSATDAAKIQTK